MSRQKFKFTPSSTSTVVPTTLATPAAGTSIEGGKTKPSFPSLPSAAPSEESTHPLELKFISRKKIVFHDHNDYEQNDIEKLADSILNCGLIHPMEAVYDAEQDIYILDSGERRTRAIDYLLKKFLNTDCDKDSPEYHFFLKNVKGFANGYPVHVIRPTLTEDGELTELEKINSLLRLDEANLQVREMDPLTRANFLKRRKDLIQQRNDLLPQNLKTNVNKALASASGLSERTIMKYTSIAERLIPELQEEFQKKNITLNEGSAYAQLTEEEQRGLLELIQSGDKVSKTEIEQLRAALQEREREKDEKTEQLKVLQERKKEVEQELEQTLQAQEAERERIEKSIQEKYATEQEVNAAERDALKNMLQRKEEEISQIKQKSESESNAAQKEISELQKRLAEIGNKPLLDPKEQKIIKLTAAHEANVKNMENSIIIACKTLKQLASLEPEKKKELTAAFLEALQIGTSPNEEI